MKDQDKTKVQLIGELETLRQQVRALEAVEKKYNALEAKLRLLREFADDQQDNDALETPSDKRPDATVLVVDDNEIFRLYITNALSHHGYTVLEAEGSDEALQVLENAETPVDLIVVDVVMPGVGGSELVQTVKAMYPKVKVLFMSGYTDEILVHSDVQAVMESNVAFLQKPFLTGELLKKVRNELDKADI
ncbi:MAG: response regulator [Desulfobacterales bacterium]|jgi:CheY-like chemotaxis protein|nr:response regulator [Desulfobacterales bacterium]